MHHLKILALSILIVVLCGPCIMAQDAKFEFSPVFGFTASSGVDIDPQDLQNGLALTRVSPKGSFSWGLNFDYLLTEHFSLGFLWSQQMSKVRGETTAVAPSPTASAGEYDFADLSVYTYHAIFTYNFGDSKSVIRPFIFGGLGATQYSPGSVNPGIEPFRQNSSGSPQIEGFSKISTTWGGGIKAFVNPHLGFKFTARWTPTYIKSEAGGIWCSPYWPWGCYLMADDQYSNQGEFTGGVLFRF